MFSCFFSPGGRVCRFLPGPGLQLKRKLDGDVYYFFSFREKAGLKALPHNANSDLLFGGVLLKEIG